jgi:hypothetical protein
MREKLKIWLAAAKSAKKSKKVRPLLRDCLCSICPSSCAAAYFIFLSSVVQTIFSSPCTHQAKDKAARDEGAAVCSSNAASGSSSSAAPATGGEKSEGKNKRGKKRARERKAAAAATAAHSGQPSRSLSQVTTLRVLLEALPLLSLLCCVECTTVCVE